MYFFLSGLGLLQTMITAFAFWEKVITAFMAGLKNPHTCNIPAVVASVRIFESSVGREECTNSSTEEVEKAAGRTCRKNEQLDLGIDFFALRTKN